MKRSLLFAIGFAVAACPCSNPSSRKASPRVAVAEEEVVGAEAAVVAAAVVGAADPPATVEGAVDLTAQAAVARAAVRRGAAALRAAASVRARPAIPIAAATVGLGRAAGREVPRERSGRTVLPRRVAEVFARTATADVRNRTFATTTTLSRRARRLSAGSRTILRAFKVLARTRFGAIPTRPTSCVAEWRANAASPNP
jgi:hypothetical protein